MTSTTKVLTTMQSATAEPLTEDGSLHTNIIIIGGCILCAVAVGALLYVAVLVYQRIKRKKRAQQQQQRNGVDDDRISEEGQVTELIGMPAHPGAVGAVDERGRHSRNHTLPRDRGRGPLLPNGDANESHLLLDCQQARFDTSVAPSGLTNVTRYPLEGSSCVRHHDIASRPNTTATRWTPAAAASGTSSGPENGGLDQIVKTLSSDPKLHAMLLHIVQLSANLLQAPPQSSRGAATAACCDSQYRDVPAVHDDSSVTRPKHTAAVERAALGHGCPDEYVFSHSGRQPHDLEPQGMAAVSSGAAAASSASEAAAAVVATRSDETVAAAATAEFADVHAPAAGQLTNGLTVTAGGAAVRSPALEVPVHDARSMHNPPNAAFGCQALPNGAMVTGAAVATTAPLVVGVAELTADRRSEDAANGAGWSPGTTASGVAMGRDAAAAAAAMITDAHRPSGSRQRGVSCSAAPHGGCVEHHMSVLKPSDCTVDSSHSSGCREKMRHNMSLQSSDIRSCRVSGSVQQ